MPEGGCQGEAYRALDWAACVADAGREFADPTDPFAYWQAAGSAGAEPPSRIGRCGVACVVIVAAAQRWTPVMEPVVVAAPLLGAVNGGRDPRGRGSARGITRATGLPVVAQVTPAIAIKINCSG